MKKTNSSKPADIADDWPEEPSVPSLALEIATEHARRAKARNQALRKALAPMLVNIDTAELERIADEDFAQARKVSLARMKKLQAASLAARKKQTRPLKLILTALERFGATQEAAR
ncbi:MAG: hypothetical protein ABL974_13465 [Prosthecobacter sp.]